MSCESSGRVGRRQAANRARPDCSLVFTQALQTTLNDSERRVHGVLVDQPLGTGLAKCAGMTRSRNRSAPRCASHSRSRARGGRTRAILRGSTLGFWTATIAVLMLAGTVDAVVGERSGVGEFWRQLQSVAGRGELPSALAQSGHADVAVADEAGVSWWREGAAERAVLPPVRDLEFDSRGVLWIGTLDGLYSWERSARPAPRRLRGGEAANRIHRIVASQTALLIATGAGAYWSADGRIFQLLRVPGTASSITRVAIRPASLDRKSRANAESSGPGYLGQAQAWLYGGGRLSVVRGLEASTGIRVLDVRDVTLPRPVDDGELVDLTIDPSGDRVHLVFSDQIAWRSLAEDSSTGWHLERPGLPPGSLIRRLGWAAGRVWITTDHGLLAGETLKGPFRRASSPVGTTDCVEMRPRPPREALALCRAGLFVLAPLETRPPISSGLPELGLPPDPPLSEIRRRALLRAGLSVGRSHDLWDRLRRRAFWPELGLRFDADFDFDDQDDRDQTFVSGDTRHLRDRTRDEGQTYQAGIQLDWDLGGVAFPLESVDLSRELRQVVSLRDDVADEINQLYFERQSIREQLAISTSTSLAEAARLRWRARELDAGLDAWTGGWISEWRAQASLGADRRFDPDQHTPTSPRSP